MIPTIVNIDMGEFNVKEPATKTYNIDFERNIILGQVDQLDAVKQAVFLILNIERYDNIIYSWNYGSELHGLIGKRRAYVMSELERRITEAVTQDSRITGTADFVFSHKGGVTGVSFTVTTIYGNYKESVDVRS